MTVMMKMLMRETMNSAIATSFSILLSTIPPARCGNLRRGRMTSSTGRVGAAVQYRHALCADVGLDKVVGGRGKEPLFESCSDILRRC